MKKRDRYTLDLECPDCGRKGSARVSEAENPVYSGRAYGVDDVPEGFTLIEEGESPQGTIINCASCGKRATA